MDQFMGNPAFRIYAVCVAILVLKMIGTAIFTASTRQRVRGFSNPEDVTAVGGEGAVASETEHPDVARALRMHRNDMENIPLFFAVGLVYVLLEASALGAILYFWTFTIARVLHSFVYARAMQPARAICWGLGVLCLVGMSVSILWRVLL